MIYLDHAATTPAAPEVVEAMLPWLTARFGNPSSIYALGREARAAIDSARDAVAAALHADYGEIYFTSSGAEADNLAIIGAMLAASGSYRFRADDGQPTGRRRIVVSAIEHHAVLHSARYLESLGYEVVYLPVDAEGFVDPDRLAEALTDDTGLVSVMHANNEIGTIQDVARLAQFAHSRGALFHTDAVQSFGTLPIHVRGMGCDLLSVSGHKIYGPKGVGALYVRGGVKVAPLLHGGSQERERRAGTENVAGIVGFGAAVALAQRLREAEAARQAELRDAFIAALEEQVPGIRLNGPRTNRLPNNVNVSIDAVDGAAVLMSLDRAGIAASSGSACSSGSIEPSHVLSAIGLPPHLAAAGIRFSLGRATTRAELEEAASVLAGIVRRLRN